MSFLCVNNVDFYSILSKYLAGVAKSAKPLVSTIGKAAQATKDIVQEPLQKSREVKISMFFNTYIYQQMSEIKNQFLQFLAK